jgi:DNA-binding response OmpR family regulator
LPATPAPNTRRCLLQPVQSVLIVDESAETRAVLRTALEQPGRQVLETSDADEALRLAYESHPGVIVLDMEIERIPVDALARDLQADSLQPSSLLLLGSIKRTARGLRRGEFVAKPYHYAPLIRKIEKLLNEAAPLALAGA